MEEELVGEFVKYSVKDGKEVNFLRRDSEAGQKCCTFQHWVYEKTNGNLLVTDLQGELSSLHSCKRTVWKRKPNFTLLMEELFFHMSLSESGHSL